MLTRIGNKVTVGRPLCNVLRIGRPLEGGGSFLRDWTVYGKSEVVGSSVLGVGDVYPWNQRVDPSAYSTRTINGVTFTKNTDGSITVNGTATGEAKLIVATIGAEYSKWLFCGCPAGGSTSTYFFGTSPSYADTGNGAIRSLVTQSSPYYYSLYVEDGVTVSNLVFRPQVFNLTAIFGAGNEPSTVDAFKAWLVKVGKMSKVTDDIPYFPYDAGSTFTSLPIVASGRNLWDEEWELGDINTNTGQNTAASDRIRCKNYISVIPGKSYYLHNGGGGTGARLLTYDENYNYISSSWWSNASVYTAGTGVAYIRFRIDPNYGTTYNHDICINISDALDGTYTPHQSQRFPLVISSPLHGIGDVRDIMRYSLHGITRKYGVVDLGSLTWAKRVYGTKVRFEAVIGEKAYGMTNCVVPIFTYNANVVNNPNNANINEWAAHPSNNLFYILVDGATYADIADFKAAMSGVLLVYELATPTFEPVTLPKLPAYRDGTVLYTDTQVHGDTIAGEAPVGFSLLPPVTMTPPTGDADTNEHTDDTATE